MENQVRQSQTFSSPFFSESLQTFNARCFFPPSTWRSSCPSNPSRTAALRLCREEAPPRRHVGGRPGGRPRPRTPTNRQCRGAVSTCAARGGRTQRKRGIPSCTPLSNTRRPPPSPLGRGGRGRRRRSTRLSAFRNRPARDSLGDPTRSVRSSRTNCKLSLRRRVRMFCVM